jgi:hypothetical protein
VGVKIIQVLLNTASDRHAIAFVMRLPNRPDAIQLSV